MENRGNTDRRLGPLHTSGNAMVTTAYKAYKRVELLPIPIGTIAQKLGRVVKPTVYILQNHWLAILSYADDQILFVEKAIENVFPPSSYIFNKIDTLVHVTETLPVRFDNAADKLPAIIQRVPYLEWALAQLFLILSFLISTLTNWGVDGANEKEIRIDTNSHDEIATNNHGLTGSEEMCIPNSTGNDTGECEEKEENEKQTKETYKDILVKQKDVNEEEINEKNGIATSYKTILEMGMKEKEDEISQQQQGEQSDNKEIGGLTCKEILMATRNKKDGREVDAETILNIPTCVKDYRLTAQRLGSSRAERKLETRTKL